MNHEDFILAGKITSIARKYAKNQIKVGLNIYDFVKKIEKKIYENNAKLAFPVNISINEQAAHNTCDYKSDIVFQKGQVVKVDLGANINGYVGDSAFTIELGTNKYSKLIKSTEKALTNALEIVTIGTRLNEIGKVIKETINEYGFNPIINLGGHGLERYNLHANMFIPNYDNGNTNKLKEDQTIAIEPFATNGKGQVTTSNIIKIYSLEKKVPTRSLMARKLLSYINKEFLTLPFAEHHLLEKFKPIEVKLGLRELIKNNSLTSYSILKEISNGIVAQSEHSLIVKKKPIITTL